VLADLRSHLAVREAILSKAMADLQHTKDQYAEELRPILSKLRALQKIMTDLRNTEGIHKFFASADASSDGEFDAVRPHLTRPHSDSSDSDTGPNGSAFYDEDD
jgi:hypothetical protein